MNIEKIHDLLCPTDELLMRPGDHYLEIGAHKGKFFEQSGQWRKEGFYHLFEPNPSLAADLYSKYADRPMVHVIYSAITGSGPPRMVDFFQGHDGPQGNSLDSRVGERCVYQVQCVGFDYAMQTLMTRSKRYANASSRVRLLALNCEGAEWEILESPAMENVDYVTVEFHRRLSDFNPLGFFRLSRTDFEVLEYREHEKWPLLFAKAKHCEA